MRISLSNIPFSYYFCDFLTISSNISMALLSFEKMFLSLIFIWWLTFLCNWIDTFLLLRDDIQLVNNSVNMTLLRSKPFGIFTSVEDSLSATTTSRTSYRSYFRFVNLKKMKYFKGPVMEVHVLFFHGVNLSHCSILVFELNFIHNVEHLRLFFHLLLHFYYSKRVLFSIKQLCYMSSQDFLRKKIRIYLVSSCMPGFLFQHPFFDDVDFVSWHLELSAGPVYRVVCWLFFFHTKIPANLHLRIFRSPRN